MSIDELRQKLPVYAKDLTLNLSSMLNESNLSDQQKWGCLLACAYAEGVGEVITAFQESAQLSPEALTAAKTAAALMAMNNVYYRSIHLMQNSEYGSLPARLRMSALANPGVDKNDFELWCAAVSAINGCGKCLDAHESELRKRGVPAIAVQAAIRIAAVVSAVSRVVRAEREAQRASG